MPGTLGKAPGYVKSPGHKISIRLADSRWEARSADVLLAASARAVILEEAGYAPVVYFPPEDVRFDRLEAASRKTACPFKGEASYFAVPGGDIVAWTYPVTYDEVTEIAGRVAFYADRVELIQS